MRVWLPCKGHYEKEASSADVTGGEHEGKSRACICPPRTSSQIDSRRPRPRSHTHAHTHTHTHIHSAARDQDRGQRGERRSRCKKGGTSDPRPPRIRPPRVSPSAAHAAGSSLPPTPRHPEIRAHRQQGCAPWQCRSRRARQLSLLLLHLLSAGTGVAATDVFARQPPSDTAQCRRPPLFRRKGSAAASTSAQCVGKRRPQQRG